jgi:hypothetical protein
LLPVVPAPRSQLDRFAELLERCRIVRLIRRVHSPYSEDRRVLVIGLGQRSGLRQPARRGTATSGLDLHEAELTMSEYRRRPIARLLGHQDRFVQDDRALLVMAAHRMYECTAESGERATTQYGVVAMICLRDRSPETLDACVDSACGDRGPAGFQLARSRGSTAQRRTSCRARPDLRRFPQGSRRLNT